MWYCYRRQMKHFMKKYHQRSHDPRVAYDWKNYESGRMQKICRAKHHESRYNMVSCCTFFSINVNRLISVSGLIAVYDHKR